MKAKPIVFIVSAIMAGGAVALIKYSGDSRNNLPHKGTSLVKNEAKPPGSKARFKKANYLGAPRKTSRVPSIVLSRNQLAAFEGEVSGVIGDWFELPDGKMARSRLCFAPLEERLAFFESFRDYDPLKHGGAMRMLLKDLYEISPEQAIEFAIDHPEQAALLGLGDSLGKNAQFESLSTLKAVPGYETLLEAFVQGLATVDPENALVADELLGTDSALLIGTDAALAGKAKQAIEAFRGLQVPNREKLVSSVYYTWACRDPAAAMADLLKGPFSEVHDYNLSAVVKVWESRRPEEYEAWHKGIGDPDVAKKIAEVREIEIDSINLLLMR